ncbi:GNAT family N-acetyltransferase [Mycobacterium sp. CVI_P3]|uniref:GNAT family N-acetyltransferase n=1 Tax=Mycobacterium pinniadriaticum TaxID=2994102 RepID=A0ABT3SN73_9MYCO|nr:GNAT family N-acetyltransferase [Mycobacterium pinniadriaticum]MCX2934177.1 GNAT family N-acetyltransferase [Mycobacterium pinniadriaticum]MCX2940599.1 GNAT family N-acetyltransferase [Mycobacterium pinniadriaticum]
MTSLPLVGSRVRIRYRLPAGTTPPMADVIGELRAAHPVIVVRTKSDGLVEVRPDDVVAVRELSVVPVRASEIRAVEHAAALAWPGTEQSWQDGWLLRAGGGYTSRANSAVPLSFWATTATIPAIIDWYRERELTPWLALPERLLPIRADGVKHTRVMVTDLAETEPEPAVTLLGSPDAAWLACYERDVPADVLTAVVDGEAVFAAAREPGGRDAAAARGAITDAPDGTRWLGISAVHVGAEQRRRGHARRLCLALQAWGVQHGATRVYVQVLSENTGAITLYHSLGFRLHHHHRYVDARSLTTRTL